ASLELEANYTLAAKHHACAVGRAFDRCKSALNLWRADRLDATGALESQSRFISERLFCSSAGAVHTVSGSRVWPRAIVEQVNLLTIYRHRNAPGEPCSCRWGYCNIEGNILAVARAYIAQLDCPHVSTIESFVIAAARGGKRACQCSGQYH